MGLIVAATLTHPGSLAGEDWSAWLRDLVEKESGYEAHIHSTGGRAPVSAGQRISLRVMPQPEDRPRGLRDPVSAEMQIL